MSATRLTPEEIRALARMARGGVYLDRDGRGLQAGRPVIDRGTVSALAEAQLIEVRSTHVPQLTGAGRAFLAGRQEH